MVVLRRLDALLEESKDEVMEEVRFQREEAGFNELDDNGLKEASGYVFYNTSKWTMQRLYDTATNNQQRLEANFKAYLDGFSKNVKEIIEKFKLRSQIQHMAKKDVLLDVLEKFTSPRINLTPHPKQDPDGRTLLPLTNLGMGYVFEELIRKFNEENNEEAGEHFTPREVIQLMTHLIFDPIKEDLPPVMTIYDPACGTGGMLTESQKFIKDENGAIRANGDIYLFGKEINDETYAICKSDMMIKGNDPENIKNGSTLRTDEFSDTNFNYMLSNPPYGKSWTSDKRYIKDGREVIDSRFIVELKDYWGESQEVDAIPRSSDGQLLFLMEMVDKMKSLDDSPSGSRIASVHNGSSLFTGGAGGGESNIRRYFIENDLVEAIIQMPNNLFYNTGITTYVWILSNNKTPQRKGKVQLIDAIELYRKLRKNLGEKNCEFAPEHITEITEAYRSMTEVEREEDEGIASQVFDNRDFGYYDITIERPQRLKAQFTEEAVAELRFKDRLKEPMKWAWKQFGEEVYTNLANHKDAIRDWCEENEMDLTKKQRQRLLKKSTWERYRSIHDAAQVLLDEIGTNMYDDFNVFENLVEQTLKEKDIKLKASDRKKIYKRVSWYDSSASKVVKRVHTLKGEKLATLLEHLGCTREELPDFGYYPTDKEHKYIEYESSTDLRDSENVPLKEDIHGYFLREVKPHVEEAWIALDRTKIGYEISFNKYFYRHKPLRSVEEVSSDIMELENESEGLIREILELA
jgi:type I restriction enzyme M protein